MHLSILLVADNPTDVQLISEHVTAAGFNVDSEESVERAAQHLRRRRFDLVLLDLSLPDSQGLVSFKRIHAVANDTPIVVLTKPEDMALAARAVAEGAKDYLFKSRMSVDSLIGSIRSAILRFRRQPAESELSITEKIQRRLFVDETPQLAGFDISSRSSPSAFACGDFLDFFSLGEDRLGIMVADVVGRGFAQGIAMCETRATIRAFANVRDDVGEILTLANSTLASDLNEETFVALFLASIDSSSETIQFASAGHFGFVLDQSGRAKQLLKTDDPPLGLNRLNQFKTSADVRLSEGEGLLLMTDRLADGVGPSESRFGTKQVLETIRARYRLGSRPALDHVFDQINRLTRETHDNEVTAILIKAQPNTPSQQRPTAEPAEESVVFRETFRHFEIESDGDPVVVRLRDAEILSAETVDGLSQELLDYLSRSELSYVIISFRSVEKFTSEGINLCLMIKKTLEDRGTSLRLCDMRPSIRDAFKALNLDGAVFEIHEEVGDALGASSRKNGDTSSI